MKLHFTSEWLQRQIDRDEDLDTEAGIPLRDTTSLAALVQKDAAPATAQVPVQARSAQPQMAVLHFLVHQLRRRDGLTIPQLADRIRVEPEELEHIEQDPSYVPRPRTMHMLASYMKVSTQAVQSLTVDAIARNDNVAQAALKFAASSKDLSALSSAERRGLNDFVKFLSRLKE